jgi:alcohol dehydrogenase class IV
VARIVTGNQTATVDDGVKWVSDLVSELKIPSLSSHGMTETHIPEAVQKTLNASSYKGNPLPLNEQILSEILTKAL